MKLPLMWPKSSDSISSSGMAAQLTSTKGPLLRRLAACSDARNEFLAGAAFAENEDAAVGGSGHCDLLAKSFHGNAVADDLIAVAEFGAQGLVFFFEAALLHGVSNENDNFFESEGLFDEVECTEFGGADRSVNGGVAGDHDDGGRMRKSLNTAESFKAVHAREPDVQKNDVEAAVRGAFEGAFGGLGGFGDVAFVGENGRQRFADAGFVVDDQNVRAWSHRFAYRLQNSASERERESQ